MHGRIFEKFGEFKVDLKANTYVQTLIIQVDGIQWYLIYDSWINICIYTQMILLDRNRIIIIHAVRQ